MNEGFVVQQHEEEFNNGRGRGLCGSAQGDRARFLSPRVVVVSTLVVVASAVVALVDVVFSPLGTFEYNSGRR